MISDWKNIALYKSASLKDAMKALDDSGLRVIFVIDQSEHLLATVTDGDIRRGLLAGLNLDAPVSLVMKSNPICISSDATKESIQDILRNANVLALPVVDGVNKVIGLETIDTVEDKFCTDTTVVLMAGGFGKRLLPLTDHVPKPMLPLGNRPIIERIVEDFKLQGFKNFCITTHYKAEIIQKHFEKNPLNVNIEFFNEDEPLGTAGSLFLLKDRIHSDFFVMNADLLVKTNFKNLLAFHKKNNQVATMCVKQHSYQVPFGVVQIEDMGVLNIIEKPLYSHFINSGIYCFNESIFKFCNEKKYMDMPTLLQNLITENKKICAFPIHEHWVDIGCMDDYQKVNASLK